MSLSFATASNQGKLEIWNVESIGTIPRAVYNLRGIVPIDMHALPQYDELLVASTTGSVCLLSLVNGQIKPLFRVPELSAIALAQDGQRVAIGTQYGDGMICSLPPPFGRRNRRVTFRCHTGPITCLTFGPDDELLLTGSTDQLLNVLDVGNGKLLQCCEDHNSVVTCCEFTDKLEIISCSGINEGRCRLCNRETGGVLAYTYDNPVGIQSMALSYSDELVYLGTADGRIQIWDYRRNSLLNKAIVEPDVPINKLWLINNEYLLASCANGVVHRVNITKLISEYRWLTSGSVSSTLIIT